MAIESLGRSYVLTEESAQVLIEMLEAPAGPSPLEGFESRLATQEDLERLNRLAASTK